MTLAGYHNIPEGDDQFPDEFIESRGLVKLAETDTRVAVGTRDAVAAGVHAELEFFLSKSVALVPVPATEWAEFLSHRFSFAGKSALAKASSSALDTVAHDAPIVNLVNTVVLEGLRRRCSDIHWEADYRGARVRYRIDGVLQPGRDIEPSRFPEVTSRLKVLASLDIVERRLPQDGRLALTLGGQTLEFRISVVPLADGESVVLRLFQKQGEVPGLAQLGFRNNQEDHLRWAARQPNGLVLVTGPTGSGKTTTLNSLVKEIASPEVKVITIEDPVENFLAGVNQIQTNDAIGLSFDSLLRRVLRQDPDVLMVGEIRDQETAELCVRSALTGHLVLSTLHTNDALSSIPRLINMGIEPFLLASVLRSCNAQRLVRTLCPECRQEVAPTLAQAEQLKTWGVEVDRISTARGCEHCQGTGRRGRTVVAEVFPVGPDDEVWQIRNQKHQDLLDHFSRLGYRPLAFHAAEKVAAGLVDFQDVVRLGGLA